MAGGSRDPGRSVTSKVIAVLATFENAAGAQSLADISAASGLAVSTTHRLIGELTESGLLERTSRGRYQVGIRLWELAQKAGRHLREAARPWVQDLSAVTHQSVTISVRMGRDSLVIERAHGNRQLARMSPVGSRIPLHASAAGKVLLAFEAEGVRQAYLEEPLQRLTSDTQIDHTVIERELASAAQVGFAQSLQEVRIGASAIAVPVMHSGQIAASVAVVAEAQRASQLRQYLPALRATAAGIENATRHMPRDALLGAEAETAPGASDEL